MNEHYATPPSKQTLDDEKAAIGLDARDAKKLDAVLAAARNYWVLLMLSLFFLPAILILPISYWTRLLQWKKLAKKYPGLTAGDARPGSLPAKFQSCQWKLVVAVMVGMFLFALLILMLVFVVLSEIAENSAV